MECLGVPWSVWESHGVFGSCTKHIRHYPLAGSWVNLVNRTAPHTGSTSPGPAHPPREVPQSPISPADAPLRAFQNQGSLKILFFGDPVFPLFDLETFSQSPRCLRPGSGNTLEGLQVRWRLIRRCVPCPARTGHAGDRGARSQRTCGGSER